jgi:hypothetical protein
MSKMRVRGDALTVAEASIRRQLLFNRLAVDAWSLPCHSADRSWFVSGPSLRDRWVVTPAVTAALCLATAAMAYLLRSPVWMWLTAVAAAAAICSVLGAWRSASLRVRVEWDDEGFLVIRASREEQFRDDQVTGMAWSVSPWFVSGRRMGELRLIELWLQRGSNEERVLLKDGFTDGQRDPLQPLIRRLSQRQLEASRALLSRRESISGAGWEWTADGIAFDASDVGNRFDPREFTAVELLDGELRIWSPRQDQPSAVLNAAGRDVWLLASLLREQIPAANVSTAPEEVLGRIVFERRPAPGIPWLLLALGCAGLAVGMMLGAVGLSRGLGGLVALGGALGFAGGAVGIAGLKLRRSSFRCCERGMRSSGLGAAREIRFDEVDIFSFDVRRQSKRGRYAGTLYVIAAASSTQKNLGILHSETAPHELEEFDWLRDCVSEHVARRMAEKLATKGRVQWTRELTLTAEGIDYRPQGWLRRWEADEFIPHASIIDFELRDGWFVVWTEGSDRAVLKARTADPNFYPGLVLFEQMEARRSAAAS